MEAFDECEDGLDELIKQTVWPEYIKCEIDQICGSLSEERDTSQVDGKVEHTVQDGGLPMLADMRVELQKMKEEQEFEDKYRRECEIRAKVEEEFAMERNNQTILKDAVTLGLRRELRFQGNIGGSDDKKLTYISLQSQVSEARQIHYTDKEIAFALRKAVANGSELRQFLDALDAGITLEDILGYIRSFYKEKTAA